MPATQVSPHVSQTQSSAPPRISRLAVMLPFLPVLLLWLAPALSNGLRATSMLWEMEGAAPLAASDANPVYEEEIVFSSLEPTRARVYHPTGIAHPSPLVVVHGMHNLGMDEPRLRRFARGLAGH